MEKIDLAETLKNLRKQQNLSQESLADLLHVSRQSLSKWERGEAVPDIYSLNKLASLYKISLDDLVNGNIKTSFNATEEKEEPIPKNFSFNIYITILGILLTIFCAAPYSLIAESGIGFLAIKYFYISFWVLVPPFIHFIRMRKSYESKNGYFLFYLISFILSLILLLFLSNYTLKELYGALILLSIFPAFTLIISAIKPVHKFMISYKNIYLNIFTFSAITFQLFTFLSESFYSYLTILSVLASSILSFFTIFLALKKQAGIYALNIVALVVSSFNLTFAFAVINKMSFSSMSFTLVSIISIVVQATTIILNLTLNSKE